MSPQELADRIAWLEDCLRTAPTAKQRAYCAERLKALQGTSPSLGAAE